MTYKPIKKPPQRYKSNSLYGACIDGNKRLYNKIERELMKLYKKVNEND